jgi:pyruvate dehydrogenase E2 component (dihydrolipoamide acetyltransferase)
MSRIIMPRAGQTMEEGTILHWYKREGETVNRGELLLDIDTDKAAIEVEAPESGILRKILCPEGACVPVLAPIAIIAGPAEDVEGEIQAAQLELKAATGETTSEQALPDPADGIPLADAKALRESAGVASIKASPAARKASRELGIDLEQIALGSGPYGRILSSDVLRAADAAAAASGSRAATGAARRPLAGMRGAIARTMLSAKQRIPHFYVKTTIDADPLLVFYRKEKAAYACTINDIVTLACARVIKEFPAFRSRIEEDAIVEFPAASIGIAVGMEDGLAVPVVVGAESMSLKQLASETERIVEAARHGKIIAMGQGVFTVSNMGGFGIEEFTAIINPPESAILAVGAIREAVIVKDGGLRPGRVMTLVLSADHRLIDGLTAARFLRRLREVLEAPELLREEPA